MIRLVGINKKFKNLVLFEDLNLNIDQKKTKIKGENGVGKSVLLKIIVGYSMPDLGDVFYNDNCKLGEKSDFLIDAGVSINAPQFMKNWTGLENLKYLASVNKKCDENDLMQIVKDFGLENDISKKYRTYSLGMQQKLRIIQALMDKPRYLILDEPFNALDKASKLKAKEYIDRYLKEEKNRQFIYTSHSEDDDRFADCIYEIENRKIYKIETQSIPV